MKFILKKILLKLISFRLKIEVLLNKIFKSIYLIEVKKYFIRHWFLIFCFKVISIILGFIYFQVNVSNFKLVIIISVMLLIIKFGLTRIFQKYTDNYAVDTIPDLPILFNLSQKSRFFNSVLKFIYYRGNIWFLLNTFKQQQLTFRFIILNTLFIFNQFYLVSKIKFIKCSVFELLNWRVVVFLYTLIFSYWGIFLYKILIGFYVSYSIFVALTIYADIKQITTIYKSWDLLVNQIRTEANIFSKNFNNPSLIKNTNVVGTAYNLKFKEIKLNLLNITWFFTDLVDLHIVLDYNFSISGNIYIKNKMKILENLLKSWVELINTINSYLNAEDQIVVSIINFPQKDQLLYLDIIITDESLVTDILETDSNFLLKKNLEAWNILLYNSFKSIKKLDEDNSILHSKISFFLQNYHCNHQGKILPTIVRSWISAWIIFNKFLVNLTNLKCEMSLAESPNCQFYGTLISNIYQKYT